MTPIPAKIKKILATLPRMEKCEVCGCKPVEWHHALRYQGRQVQEVCAIRALCVRCHRGNNGDITPRARLVCEYNAVNEGESLLCIVYSRFDWAQHKLHLGKLLAQVLDVGEHHFF